jgi:hypothetical protein
MILTDNADKKTIQQQLEDYRELNKFVDLDTTTEKIVMLPLPSLDADYWLKVMKVISD